MKNRGRMMKLFSKKIENTVGKEENILVNTYIFSFFKKIYKKKKKKKGICASVCIYFIKRLPFTTQSRLLTTLKKMAIKNYMGKGENAGCQHFLLFP